MFLILFLTETQKKVAVLVKLFAQKHSTDFQAAVTSLPREQQAKLSAVLSAS